MSGLRPRGRVQSLVLNAQCGATTPLHLKEQPEVVWMSRGCLIGQVLSVVYCVFISIILYWNQNEPDKKNKISRNNIYIEMSETSVIPESKDGKEAVK